MDTASQTIQDFFSVLPENIQNFILDASWRNSVQDIETKYGLSDIQGGNLETEVFVTLLCMEDVRELSKNIEKGVNVSSDLALKITSELYNSVFRDIYITLSKIIDEIDALPMTNPEEEGSAPQSQSLENTGDSSTKTNILNEIENPTPSVMHVETSQYRVSPQTSAPQRQSAPNIPTNLPTMPAEHHDLMKYYAGTEPIVETPAGLPQLNPKPRPAQDVKKIVDTPRYTDSGPQKPTQ